eukprot:1157996-Pelagomonas_calceolata.AAC.1
MKWLAWSGLRKKHEEEHDPRMLNPKTEAERKLADHLSEGRAKRAAKQHIQQQQQQQQEQGAVMEVDSSGCDGCVSLQGSHDNIHPLPHLQQQQQQQHVGSMDIEGDGQQQAALQPCSSPHVCNARNHESGTLQSQGGGIQGCSGPVTQPSEQGERLVSSRLHATHPAAPTAAAAAAAKAEDAAADTTAVPAQNAPSSSGRCFYSPLPRFVKRPGMTPAELTALNMDKTTILQQVGAKKCKGRNAWRREH